MQTKKNRQRLLGLAFFITSCTSVLQFNATIFSVRLYVTESKKFGSFSESSSSVLYQESEKMAKPSL
jgi:hypothetical protein